MEDEDSKAPSSAVGTSSDSDSDESETELMVTSRIRRTTAGNRYNNVVAQEQAAEEEEVDDDVALLFAEMEGEDEEYHSDEGADDADMSSSDDDDQGPNAAAEDMDGEKEIQREAKAERARKRKADLALTSMSGLRKKPKIDPTALRRAPAPNPTKRKERVSWLPDQGFAPGRTSLRKQTLEHRAETHAKLKKNEQQRLKAKSIRAQRVKEREADAPKEWTQADRLLEAERVERRNAKSLNRWEAMERKRQEEQAAKLAALKDRKLKGAVVSMRSARHTFQGWRNKDTPEGEFGEVKKRGRKSKAYLEQLAAAKLLQTAPILNVPSTPLDLPTHPSNINSTSSVSNQQVVTPTANNSLHMPTTDQQKLDDNVSDIAAQASHKPDEAEKDHQVTSTVVNSTGGPGNATDPRPELISDNSEQVAANPRSTQADDEEKPESQESRQEEVDAPPPAPVLETETKVGEDHVAVTADQESILQQSRVPIAEDAVMSTPAHNSSIIETNQMDTTEGAKEVAFSLVDVAPKTELSDDLQAPAVESTPAPEVISIRNLVVLENFDSASSQVRNEYGFFYSTRKTTTKPIKHTPELCLITGLPVRYRDPVTGLGYHDATAFKKIKELRDHKYVWSSMLGCYAGRAGLVARGVPEGFSG